MNNYFRLPNYNLSGSGELTSEQKTLAYGDNSSGAVSGGQIYKHSQLTSNAFTFLAADNSINSTNIDFTLLFDNGNQTLNISKVDLLGVTFAGGIATYTTVNDKHGLTSSQPATVRGFNETEFNIVNTAITVISPNQFTAPVAGSPPATGTGSGTVESDYLSDSGSPLLNEETAEIVGTTSNDGIYTITSVSPNKITFAEAIVNETPVYSVIKALWRYGFEAGDRIFVDKSDIDNIITTRVITGDGQPITNRFLYSETLDNPYWLRTRANISAYNPLEDAYTLTCQNLGGNGSVFISSPGVVLDIPGIDHNISFEAKAGTASFFAIRITNFNTSPFVYFNLAGGTIGTIQSPLFNAKIEYTDNGFYRCSITYTSQTDLTGAFGFYIATTDNGAFTVPLDGNQSVKIRNFQFTQSTNVQPYVETTTAPVTVADPRLNLFGIRSTRIGAINETSIFLDNPLLPVEVDWTRESSQNYRDYLLMGKLALNDSIRSVESTPILYGDNAGARVQDVLLLSETSIINRAQVLNGILTRPIITTIGPDMVISEFDCLVRYTKNGETVLETWTFPATTYTPTYLGDVSAQIVFIVFVPNISTANTTKTIDIVENKFYRSIEALNSARGVLLVVQRRNTGTGDLVNPLIYGLGFGNINMSDKIDVLNNGSIKLKSDAYKLNAETSNFGGEIGAYFSIDLGSAFTAGRNFNNDIRDTYYVLEDPAIQGAAPELTIATAGRGTIGNEGQVFYTATGANARVLGLAPGVFSEPTPAQTTADYATTAANRWVIYKLAVFPGSREISMQASDADYSSAATGIALTHIYDSVNLDRFTPTVHVGYIALRGDFNKNASWATNAGRYQFYNVDKTPY